MTTTQKAVRATIKLGDTELDVFQLPNGEYRLSKGQACDVVNLDRKRLSQIFQKNSLKALLGEGKSLSEFTVKSKVEGENANLDLLPINIVLLLWSEVPEGKVLVQAAAFEALERRADTAFGIQRTEEERNERLKLRSQSKITRRSYTDILKEKLIEQYGEDGYKAMAKQGYFRDVTIKVNMHLFGQPHFKCDRDNMTTDQLVDIEHFEKMLERRARRYPEHTAEQLMQWMVEQF